MMTLGRDVAPLDPVVLPPKHSELNETVFPHFLPGNTSGLSIFQTPALRYHSSTQPPWLSPDY